jgi:hypothetical protein
MDVGYACEIVSYLLLVLGYSLRLIQMLRP